MHVSTGIRAARIQGEKKAGRLSGFIQSVRKRGIFFSCLS